MIFSSPGFVLLFPPATVPLYYALLRGAFARFTGARAGKWRKAVFVLGVAPNLGAQGC